MPGMNGLEVQRRLALEGIVLPLVFITAHEEDGIAERAIAAGAVGFLQKPFTDQSLIKLIRLRSILERVAGIGRRAETGRDQLGHLAGTGTRMK